MTVCRGCGREIVWAITSHGKRVPLDPKALVFSVAPQGRDLIAVKPTPGVTGERFMVSHFATCPKANEFSGQSRMPEHQPDFNEPKEVEA